MPHRRSGVLDLRAAMNDFDELIPGSWAAKRRGCMCQDSGGPDFRANPDCIVHGVAEFKRALQSTEGKAAIDRFRQHVEWRRIYAD